MQDADTRRPQKACCPAHQKQYEDGKSDVKAFHLTPFYLAPNSFMQQRTRIKKPARCVAAPRPARTMVKNRVACDHRVLRRSIAAAASVSSARLAGSGTT